MAEGLYASFAEVLSLCQSFKDELAVILDPESGFAPRMRELCEQQYVESGQTGSLYPLTNDIDWRISRTVERAEIWLMK
jgi:hypothetical protein